MAPSDFSISHFERVPGAFLTDVLGLSRRQVVNLTRDKVLTQSVKGKYNLAESVQAYNAYSSDGHVSLSARQAPAPGRRRD